MSFKTIIIGREMLRWWILNAFQTSRPSSVWSVVSWNKHCIDISARCNYQNTHIAGLLLYHMCEMSNQKKIVTQLELAVTFTSHILHWNIAVRDNLDMEHSAHSAGQSEEFCTWAGRQSVKLTIHYTVYWQCILQCRCTICESDNWQSTISVFCIGKCSACMLQLDNVWNCQWTI